MRTTIITAALTALLTGCGGGGGQQEEPQPAANGKVSFTVDYDLMEVSWIDAFDNETSYLIEKRNLEHSNIEWETVASTGALPTGAQGSVNLNAITGTYRVSALLDNGVQATVSNDAGVTQFSIDTLQTEISINFSASVDPYSGEVEFGLNGSASSVQWFVDTVAAGESATLVLDTTRLINGTHRLDVLAEISSGVYAQTDFVFSSYNSGLSMIGYIGNLQIPMMLVAQPESLDAIISVEFWVNGELVELQTAEKPEITLMACRSSYIDLGCGGHSDQSFVWYTDWEPVHGDYDIEIVATDSAGSLATERLAYRVNDPPIIYIDSPAHPLLTGDTLSISGSIESDDAVTADVLLGDIVIGSVTDKGAFSVSYSLVGLPSGSYAVTVRAIDSYGAEIIRLLNIVYSPGSNAELVYSLAPGESVAHINEDYLVINKGVYMFERLNMFSGETIAVDLSAEQSPSNVKVTESGNVYYSVYDRYIKQWSPAGIRNLSYELQAQLGNYGFSLGNEPFLNGSVISWTGWHTSQYDEITGTLTEVSDTIQLLTDIDPLSDALEVQLTADGIEVNGVSVWPASGFYYARQGRIFVMFGQHLYSVY
ncbi:hypothetical protein EZV61_13865 [Corallincola luteus]|uniref:Ig-like domain-containing protein n=1 Tax=Corallincola luteus TaxID=1775177 RepID=A0ABY2AID5_9GAMM|nr:hypothetical protein [Corallincola luteus]TCI02439.1 hypothetical protein EZV61_13865 [Corallincola luteus]